MEGEGFSVKTYVDRPDLKGLYYNGMQLAVTGYRPRDDKFCRSIIINGSHDDMKIAYVSDSHLDGTSCFIGRGNYGLNLPIVINIKECFYIVAGGFSDEYDKILEISRAMDRIYYTINAEIGFDQIFAECVAYREYQDIHWPDEPHKHSLVLDLPNNSFTLRKLEDALGKDSCISKLVKRFAELRQILQ